MGMRRSHLFRPQSPARANPIIRPAPSVSSEDSVGIVKLRELRSTIVKCLRRAISRFWNHPCIKWYISFSKRQVRLARPWCVACVDSFTFNVITFVVTIYALLGDDIRKCLPNNDGLTDTCFNICTIGAMFLFTFELVACSIGKEDYFLGFFFYLDVIATASLLLDITWLWAFIFADTSLARAGRMSKIGTRAGRVMRVLRLI